MSRGTFGTSSSAASDSDSASASPRASSSRVARRNSSRNFGDAAHNNGQRVATLVLTSSLYDVRSYPRRNRRVIVAYAAVAATTTSVAAADVHRAARRRRRRPPRPVRRHPFAHVVPVHAPARKHAFTGFLSTVFISASIETRGVASTRARALLGVPSRRRRLALHRLEHRSRLAIERGERVLERVDAAATRARARAFAFARSLARPRARRRRGLGTRAPRAENPRVPSSRAGDARRATTTTGASKTTPARASTRRA